MAVRAGESVQTSMIVIEIRQVTNEALLKTLQPARMLVSAKVRALKQ
jgi:hypothetical protein